MILPIPQSYRIAFAQAKPRPSLCHWDQRVYDVRQLQRYFPSPFRAWLYPGRIIILIFSVHRLEKWTWYNLHSRNLDLLRREFVHLHDSSLQLPGKPIISQQFQRNVRPALLPRRARFEGIVYHADDNSSETALQRSTWPLKNPPCGSANTAYWSMIGTSGTISALKTSSLSR